MQSGHTMRMEYENDENIEHAPPLVHVQNVDSGQPVDDRTLNFSTTPDEIDQTFMKKPKIIRDPLSHRIIEKRRRDRMNNCLADLSRLLPISYLKQGQGRIEKTEIIEMAIKHIHNVTSIANKQGLKSSLPDRYLGFKECQDEVMRYLVEIEGWEANNKLCNRLMAHLEQAGEKFRIMNDETLTQGAREEQYRHADEHSQSVELGTLEYCNDNSKVQGVQYTKQHPNHQMAMQVDTNQMNIAQQTSFPGYETFADAQQITQEHLQRDNHLWTLLTSNYNPSRTSKDSGRSTETGSSSSAGTGQVRNGSMQDDRMYRTDNLNMSFGSASTDTCSEKSDSIVYKFKDNITKRFSQEKKTTVAGEPRKRVEKSVDKPKRKFRPIRSPSPSSSGSYRCRNSDGSNVAPSSIGDSGSNGDEDIKPSHVLPGFVLHPAGTHYIPLTIHRSNMDKNIFAQLTQQGQCVFHPISIPVNFGGTHLYIKKVSLRSNGSQSTEPSSLSSGSPSGCGSVENSSCSPAIDSPSSEQDSIKN